MTQSRKSGSDVPSEFETWPIIEHEPEHEPDVPPDLFQPYDPWDWLKYEGVVSPDGSGWSR